MKALTTIAFLITVVFSAATFAADVKTRGAYIGAAYGVTELDDDDAYARGFDDEDEAIQLWVAIVSFPG